MKLTPIIWLLLAYLLIGIFTIHYFNGTGDQGDSVHHFLYAKYAPQHPKLFFDHWAKPLFVLFASPFAQFGFTGIKVFNLLISIITVFLTYKTAKLYGYKDPVLAALFVICAPLNYILTFSGLTEPLFALFLIWGVYLAKKEQHLASAVVISFLPFIRSEGLIFLGVFGFWFLLNKKTWAGIPVLLFGHIAYSLAGYFVYQDLLWIFTKIPYATLNSTYGAGKPDHFVTQLNFILGIPLYVLIWLGMVAFVISWFQKKQFFNDETILILGGFLAFFVAHSLFWYLGIFNSAGLTRVFVGVMPLMALICLKGFHLLTNTPYINAKFNLVFKTVLVLVVVIFPLTSNRAAIGFKENMMLSRDQELAKEIAAFLAQNHTVSGTYFYAHPYLSEILNRDHFDPKQRRNLTTSELRNLRKGDIVIWEDWFAVIENGVTEEQLKQIPELQKLRIFSTSDQKGNARFVIYRQN